jgi:hypothetical protein
VFHQAYVRMPKPTKPSKPTPLPPTPKLSLGHSLASPAVITEILLARLEIDKSFDWYDLSLRMNQGKTAPKHTKKKGGKKRKEDGEEEEKVALSGHQLRDVYYDVNSLRKRRERRKHEELG